MQSMQSVRSMLSTQSVRSMQNAPSSHLFESNRSSESEESEGSCELPERIEIPSESEIYICGYGLKRTSENAWMSVRFDLSHVKEVTAGCVDGKIQADFKSLDAGFFGKTLSTMSEVVMMLSSTPSRIVLTLSNGTQKLFETALDVESAYFAWKIRADATPNFDMSIYTLACSSLNPVVKWSDRISVPSPLRFLPSFLNGVLQTDDVFEATQTPRMLTTDRGYSYGTAAITIEVGENGIGGVGVCCRPLNEYDPEHDSNACYYDIIEGKMVGGCENVVVPSVFINPGHIVRFTVDFELGILTLSVNSEIFSVHITHSLQNRPYSMYPCVLFNHPGQSFRLLHSELLSGKDLGSVIGGDLALQSALSRLSTLYWEQQDAYEAEFSEKERAIPPNAINSEVNLSLIGNGAVCSAYSIHGKNASFPDGLIVKRIHPYLHSHTQSQSFVSVLQEIDWRQACESDDYLKSFLFDFLVCFNLRHASFVQQYSVQEGPLFLTSREASLEDKTYYLFAEQLSCSLDSYLKQLNSPCGLGYYDALLVLLRLSLVLEHCFAYQIVHNDLKPDNIMLRNNNIADICLIDFGESFLGFDVVSDSPVVTKGNQHFKAPELGKQYFDSTVIDSSRADVWSLGILAYTLIGQEANVPRILEGKFGFDSFVEGAYAEKYKQFIREILVPNPLDRPDAFECVRILLNLLFDIPKSRIDRINELLCLIRRQMGGESINPVLIQCFYEALCD